MLWRCISLKEHTDLIKIFQKMSISTREEGSTRNKCLAEKFRLFSKSNTKYILYQKSLKNDIEIIIDNFPFLKTNFKADFPI